MASVVPSFPLYDELLERSKDIKLSHEMVCSTVIKLPLEHLNNIYLLIIHHSNITKAPSKTEMPYSGKCIKKCSKTGSKLGAIIKIVSLPDTLLKIIQAYLLMMRG